MGFSGLRFSALAPPTVKEWESRCKKQNINQKSFYFLSHLQDFQKKSITLQNGQYTELSLSYQVCISSSPFYFIFFFAVNACTFIFFHYNKLQLSVSCFPILCSTVQSCMRSPPPPSNFNSPTFFLCVVALLFPFSLPLQLSLSLLFCDLILF